MEIMFLRMDSRFSLLGFNIVKRSDKCGMEVKIYKNKNYKNFRQIRPG